MGSRSRPTREELCSCLVSCLAVAKSDDHRTDSYKHKVEEITEILEELMTPDTEVYIKKGDIGFDNQINGTPPEGVYLLEGRGEKKPAVVIAWFSPQQLEGLIAALLRDIGYRSNLLGAVLTSLNTGYRTLVDGVAQQLVEFNNGLTALGIDIRVQQHRRRMTSEEFNKHVIQDAHMTTAVILGHKGFLRRINKQAKEETHDADVSESVDKPVVTRRSRR